MCSLNDAKRHEALALLYQKENNLHKMREHFLEAASIYVLQAELSKNDTLLQNANECYAKSQGNNTSTKFTKQELAQKTLNELQEFQQVHHHHDVLQNIRELVYHVQ